MSKYNSQLQQSWEILNMINTEIAKLMNLYQKRFDEVSKQIFKVKNSSEKELIKAQMQLITEFLNVLDYLGGKCVSKPKP